MRTIAAVVAAVGALMTLTAAAWLFFGFKPTNPRYVEDGMLYPGAQRSTVLPNLLHDQRRATGLALAGGAVQFVASTLALAS